MKDNSNIIKQESIMINIIAADLFNNWIKRVGNLPKDKTIIQRLEPFINVDSDLSKSTKLSYLSRIAKYVWDITKRYSLYESFYILFMEILSIYYDGEVNKIDIMGKSRSMFPCVFIKDAEGNEHEYFMWSVYNTPDNSITFDPVHGYYGIPSETYFTMLDVWYKELMQRFDT